MIPAHQSSHAADTVMLEIPGPVVKQIRDALNVAQSELRYEAEQTQDLLKQDRYHELAGWLQTLWFELQ